MYKAYLVPSNFMSWTSKLFNSLQLASTMRFQILHFVAALALPFATVALPASGAEEVPAHMRGKRSYVVRDGVERTIFEHEASGATIDFVTNSGICETTPGVNQYSGYVSVGS